MDKMDKGTMIEYAKTWHQQCPCESIWDVPQSFTNLLFDEQIIPEETLKEYESEARELAMLEVQKHVQHWAAQLGVSSQNWSIETMRKVGAMVHDWSEFCRTKKMPPRMQKILR